MATAVIGGLITSTVLSLLVVPAVFTYVDDLAQWVLRLWRRGRGASAAPGAHGAPQASGAHSASQASGTPGAPQA
jgi:hypothetical protein